PLQRRRAEASRDRRRVQPDDSRALRRSRCGGGQSLHRVAAPRPGGGGRPTVPGDGAALQPRLPCLLERGPRRACRGGRAGAGARCARAAAAATWPAGLVAVAARPSAVPRLHGHDLEGHRIRAAWRLLAPTLVVLGVVAGWPLLRTIWFGFTDATL